MARQELGYITRLGCKLRGVALVSLSMRCSMLHSNFAAVSTPNCSPCPPLEAPPQKSPPER